MPATNDRLSDMASIMDFYSGPGGSRICHDDSPDGIVLISMFWDQSARESTRKESWDVYGSVRWPVARMATGHDLASTQVFLPELAI